MAAAAGNSSSAMQEEPANLVEHESRSREELRAGEVKVFGGKSDSPEAKRAKQDEIDNSMDHETAAIEEESRAAFARAEDERLQSEFREAEEKEATARAEEERRRAAAGAGSSDTLPGCAQPAAATAKT